MILMTSCKAVSLLTAWTGALEPTTELKDIKQDLETPNQAAEHVSCVSLQLDRADKLQLTL
jgi:hypothetical protein